MSATPRFFRVCKGDLDGFFGLFAASVFSAIGLMHAYKLTPGGVENSFAWFTAAPDFAIAYGVGAAVLWGFGATRRAA